MSLRGRSLIPSGIHHVPHRLSGDPSKGCPGSSRMIPGRVSAPGTLLGRAYTHPYPFGFAFRARALPFTVAVGLVSVIITGQ